jgi:tetratricopeptide (TPR) repeat protein
MKMKSLKALSLIAVALGALVCAPASSRAADELSSSCVGAEAKKAISECPGGPSKFAVGGKRAAAFKSAPPPRERKDQKDIKPTNPTEAMAAGQRDTRKERLAARSRALLITEIQGLERLYKNTPKKSADRPQLIRRLAEGYVELESAAVRDKTKAEIEAQDSKKNPTKAAKARQEAAAAKKIVEAARKSAIKWYSLMKTAYPNYSKLDEVLYYLAYEYEQAQDFKNARTVYYELIEKAPKSPYIPNAYLAFGELFFQEAQGDPSKWDLAAAAYKEVIKYPPPDNKVYGFARYKLAYVHWNKNEFAEALNEFKKVIEYGDQYSSLPNAAQLAKSARRDLIPVYAASGQPDKAFNFFKPLSGDKGGEQAKTIEMMNELGLAYLDTDLPLPDANHGRYAGHEVVGQGRDQEGARHSARDARELQQGKPPERQEARVQQPHRRAAGRVGHGLAPRGRGLRRGARHGRQEDDGSGRLPLQEGGRELHQGRVQQVRVPAHREGRLADALQDQVRDGGLAVLPAALGGVRSGVRLRRGRGPQRRECGRSRVRLGALLPEDVRRDVQGQVGSQGQGPRADRRRREGSLGEEGRVGQVQAEAADRSAEGHAHGLQPLRLLHHPAQGR